MVNTSQPFVLKLCVGWKKYLDMAHDTCNTKSSLRTLGNLTLGNTNNSLSSNLVNLCGQLIIFHAYIKTSEVSYFLGWPL